MRRRRSVTITIAASNWKKKFFFFLNMHTVIRTRTKATIAR